MAYWRCALVVELSVERREDVREIFSDYPHLNMVIDPLLFGGTGKVYVDDPSNITIALFAHNFLSVVAGDPSHRDVSKFLKLVPAHKVLMVPTKKWDEVVLSHFKCRIIPIERTGLSSKDLDIEYIKKLKERKLPKDMLVEAVGKKNIKKLYRDLADSKVIIDLFWTVETFDSLGFCVRDSHGNVVSTALAGSPMMGNAFEIQVETQAKHRKKGLATIVCAHLISYSLENGYDPCWDAADDRSAAFAQKLGYTQPERYSIYLPTYVPIYLLKKSGILRALKKVIRLFKKDFGE